MRGEVVCCIPFNTADVWSGGDRGTRRREVSQVIRMGIRRALLDERIIVLGIGLGERDHIQMVKEDPEDFFGDIGNFLGPDTVRPRLVYIGDERDWLVVLLW